MSLLELMSQVNLHSAWANVHRTGGCNWPHTHEGLERALHSGSNDHVVLGRGESHSTVSGVYHVTGTQADKCIGARLCFRDPRMQVSQLLSSSLTRHLIGLSIRCPLVGLSFIHMNLSAATLNEGQSNQGTSNGQAVCGRAHLRGSGASLAGATSREMDARCCGSNMREASIRPVCHISIVA